MKNLKKLPWPVKWFAGILAALIVLEVLLRLLFGFGTLPLYAASPIFEYALQPDQQMVRFGNRYEINAEGMRSQPLGQEEFRILKFGDSVVNGGAGTDQDDLASSIIEHHLQVDFASLPVRQAGAKYRVLNISAGSWGPDNAFAWLETHGIYDAKMIVLLFSSHDWQDQMSFREVVGSVPFYPDHQPVLAIGDAFTWVFSRHLQDVDWNALPVTKKSTIHPFNQGWPQFIHFAKAEKIPLLIYHHANLYEVQSGAWNADGQALEAYLAGQGATIISGLSAGFTPSDFRDDIHPNASGQMKIAEALLPILKQKIEHGAAK